MLPLEWRQRPQVGGGQATLPLKFDQNLLNHQGVDVDQADLQQTGTASAWENARAFEKSYISPSYRKAKKKAVLALPGGTQSVPRARDCTPSTQKAKSKDR